MPSFKKLFFKCLLVLTLIHSSLFGCEQVGYNESNGILHEICDGRIRIKIVTDYESVLDTIQEEKLKDPEQTFFHLTDWDCVVVGISDFDHVNFHRHGNTAFVVKTIKDMDIPMAVVTARWTRGSFEKFEQYAQSMESGTGIRVSDQQAFTNLKLDLRNETLRRGICIGGICFTGSSKGPVTSVLLDDPSFPKASHYTYIEDDPKYVDQMIEVFKGRTEKLTIHYYPNEIARQKHAAILEHLTLLSPLRHLSFLMRHNYEEETRQLLSDIRFVKNAKETNLYPLLVDLLHSNTEPFIDHAASILGFDLAQLGSNETVRILEHTYYHNKTTSARWLIKNLSKEILFSVSLWMFYSDKSSHPVIKDFFDTTAHKDPLIIDFFSLPKAEDEFSAIDPFMILLEAGVVHKGVIPQLEERTKIFIDNKALTQRLATAKKLLI